MDKGKLLIITILLTAIACFFVVGWTASLLYYREARAVDNSKPNREESVSMIDVVPPVAVPISHCWMELRPDGCWHATVSDSLLDAIEFVESGGRGVDTPDGDGGRAVGPFQIWQIYLDDANEWEGTDYSHEEMRDPDLSRLTVRAYFDRWGKRYFDQTGHVPTAEFLARIHNGGPNGWKKKATEGYWRRVKARMGEQE